MSVSENHKIFKSAGGSYIAYRHIEGTSPGVFYMHGTQSSMDSTKAAFVEKYCRDNGIAFTSFDFRGHGASSGKYEECNISMWLTDAINIIDNISSGKQIIIGSSMGGWIMLLLAMRRPERVAGMIGLAAAPDFTVALMEALPSEFKEKLLKEGIITLPDNDNYPETWSLDLLQDGNNNLVLNHTITTNAKVILIHGDKDVCVPLDTAFKTKDVLTAEDVSLIILKDAGHRLSRPQDLNTIKFAIEKMLKDLA